MRNQENDGSVSSACNALCGYRLQIEAAFLACLFLAGGLTGLAALLAWGPRWLLAGAAGGPPAAEARRLFLAGERAWRQALGAGSKAPDAAAIASAESLFRTALECNPDLFPVHTRLADLAELQGKGAQALLERARAVLGKAKALNEPRRQEVGRYALSLVEKAQTMGEPTADLDCAGFEAALLAGRADLAAQILARLKPRLQDPAEALWMEAQLALTVGDHPAEMEALRACLAANPGHRQAVVMLAFSLQGPEGNAEAAQALRAALQRHPQDAHLWHLLGQALFKMGDLDGAGQALEEAWRLAPYSSIVAHHLAQQQEMTGQPLRARQLRQRARELAPGPDPPPLVVEGRRSSSGAKGS